MECPHHGRLEERFDKFCIKIESIRSLLDVHITNQREQIAAAKADMDKRVDAMQDKVEILLSKRTKEDGETIVKSVVASAVITVLIGLFLHYTLKL